MKPRNHYTLEYREHIVALVKSGRSMASEAKEFGLGNQNVRNWVQEGQEGVLGHLERERTLRR